jgi:hypothetical protein
MVYSKRMCVPYTIIAIMKVKITQDAFGIK